MYNEKRQSSEDIVRYNDNCTIVITHRPKSMLTTLLQYIICESHPNDAM